MATINNIEVQGDKNGNDYGLANLTDLTSKVLELTNKILANSTAIADNLSEINLHKSNEDRHVTPALINSLVRKEVLGLYYTAAQVAEMINDISVGGGAHLKVVDELPETGLEQIIYLVPNGKTGDNVKDEYIWIDNKWEVIGSTSIDLTDYYTKNEVNNKISELDSKYVKSDDTTLVKLNNLNEINLQEDHYNAWFGYRDGKVTNWKFGDGTEGGYANIYAKDFYLNDEKLSDLLGDKANESDLNNYLPLSGGNITGGITQSAFDFIKTSTDSAWVRIDGGLTDGASLVLYGKDTGTKGTFSLSAADGTNYRALIGLANGSLLWDGKGIDVIEEQGEGYIRYSNGLQICYKQYTCNGNTDTVISLPKPFINTNYISMITSYGGGGSCSITPNSTNITGFSINNTSTISLFMNVISIGYWK